MHLSRPSHYVDTHPRRSDALFVPFCRYRQNATPFIWVREDLVLEFGKGRAELNTERIEELERRVAALESILAGFTVEEIGHLDITGDLVLARIEQRQPEVDRLASEVRANAKRLFGDAA
jgi:hypothetical protein